MLTDPLDNTPEAPAHLWVDDKAAFRVITESEWQADLTHHHARFESLVAPHMLRRSNHIKDPVADFLFEYYAFRPSHLKRYSPGIGVILQGSSADQFLKRDEFQGVDGGVALIPDGEKESSEAFLTGTIWILTLLKNTQTRTPLFGCFGLHEWAMLYRTEKPRHSQLALRVHPDELARVVEQGPLQCTHFDAFRFFTKKARPLNQVQIEREDAFAHEQPGCLHANMDVYRWAFKRAPWISSRLTMDAFEEAMKIRELDMAASPYDLSEFGIEPVAIETRAGREEYIRSQRACFERSARLRKRLIEEYELLLSALGERVSAFANQE